MSKPKSRPRSPKSQQPRPVLTGSQVALGIVLHVPDERLRELALEQLLIATREAIEVPDDKIMSLAEDALGVFYGKDAVVPLQVIRNWRRPRSALILQLELALKVQLDGMESLRRQQRKLRRLLDTAGQGHGLCLDVVDAVDAAIEELQAKERRHWQPDHSRERSAPRHDV